MVSKFTQKDLEQLENEQELAAYQAYQRNWRDWKYWEHLPSLTEKEEKEFLLGEKKCSPTLWQFFQKRKEENKLLQGFPVIIGGADIKEFENVVQELEQFFPGKGQNVGNDALVYKRFKINTDLFIEAMQLFYDQFERLGGFGGGSFEQLFSSVRMGLYSAVDNCVLSRAGLNYPDLQNNPSPRLQALKKYLQSVYLLRVRFQVFDAFVRLDWLNEDVPGFISQGQWTNFLKEVRERLRKKFGKNADKFFVKIFGSNNPPPPQNQTEFNFYQEQILTWIAKVGVVSGNPDDTPIDLEDIPTQDGFHRDYAKEQREREERQRQEEERRQRENPDWANINQAFKNNPDLQASWENKGFTYAEAREWIDVGLKPKDANFAEWLRDIKKVDADWVLNEGDDTKLRAEFQEWEAKPEEQKEEELKNNKNDNIDDNDKPKPTEPPKNTKRDKSPSRQAAEDKLEGKETKPPVETGFNSSDLNETLNSLSGALDKDSKEQGHNQPFTPAPGLGMPLGTITKEEAAKLPWICMGFNMDIEHSPFQGSTFPDWSVKDPATASALRHGEGDFITLLLCLRQVERKDDYSNVLHNFFWPTNLERQVGDKTEPIKGYERLVKNTESAKEGGEETKLLITGKQEEDVRSKKLGFNYWPFRRSGAQKGGIQFGIPGVRQKSMMFTRWMRTYDKAFDLDYTGHFIGKLKEKKLFGGFKAMGNGKIANWGSGPNRSVLWITNQLNYSKDKQDWWGDDTETINSDNGFSHYLIFSNYSTQEINEKFINHKTPANNVKTLAQLVGKLKGTVVRLGPDALELITELTPDQKEPVKNETPETKKNTDDNVKPNDLNDLGITPEEYETLKTAYTDPAMIANILKKLASHNPTKMAEMLDKMFDTIHEKSAEAMYNQMVDHNPVFTEQEKEELKKVYKEAKTKEQKKKLWEEITSNREAEKARQKREKEAKENEQKPPEQRQPDPRDKIVEEWIEKNPRYGPPGVDTEERRKRHEEWLKATPKEKEKMFKEEGQRFTAGENASQWTNYWQSGAKYDVGAGDESVGTETDNNFSGQFSFTDSINAINKLKNIFNLKPEGMEEGMKSNKPYWQVVFNHPLTYIFLFIGIVIAIMAAATRKNKS